MKIKYETLLKIDKRRWKEDNGIESEDVEQDVKDRIDEAIETEIGDYKILTATALQNQRNKSSYRSMRSGWTSLRVSVMTLSEATPPRRWRP